MSEFIQLHMLVSYPPSNLNRDDLGRPKTAMMGEKQRLRISSQSLKRAWRTSDIFSRYVGEYIGVRTRQLGSFIQNSLESGKPLTDLIFNEGGNASRKTLSPKDATTWAVKFVTLMKKGKISTGKEGEEKKEKEGDSAVSIDQLMHISPQEVACIDGLLARIAQGEKVSDEDLEVFSPAQTAVDIAMFGRMLASTPQYNVEAAVQVAHAITVHPVTVEDDYFTAVDDLNRKEEDSGAGHLGETEFAAGVFYQYVCINYSLLLENLQGDRNLAAKSLEGFVEAACTVPPTGKQNSFASRAYASYVLAEKGIQQPRSLSVAFLNTMNSEDMLKSSIQKIHETKKNFDKVYDLAPTQVYEMNVTSGTGSLKELQKFVAGPV